jgi:hypothetical protein
MVSAALATALLAACDGGLGSGVSSADAATVHAQARAALDQWENAVSAAGAAPPLVPVGELTGQIGDWEAAVGDNNKRALMAGRVFTMEILAGDARQDGEVSWPDGTTTRVPVMAAQEAIVAIGATAPTTSCDGCADLIATEASLISGPIQTSRGPAVGPIWSFAIEGTTVHVTRLAIANSLTVSPLPWNPIFSSIGLHLHSAMGTLDGKEITVVFIGAPNPGDNPCGEDYSAEAVESALAIVVVVTRHGRIELSGCTAVGAPRTATATLADPLGSRVVLNLDDGQPVPMIVR